MTRPIDILRVFTGAYGLGAGLFLLVRTVSAGLSPAALIAGLAFITFGIVRLTTVVRECQALSGTRRS